MVLASTRPRSRISVRYERPRALCPRSGRWNRWRDRGNACDAGAVPPSSLAIPVTCSSLRNRRRSAAGPRRRARSGLGPRPGEPVSAAVRGSAPAPRRAEYPSGIRDTWRAPSSRDFSDLFPAARARADADASPHRPTTSPPTPRSEATDGHTYNPVKAGLRGTFDEVSGGPPLVDPQGGNAMPWTATRWPPGPPRSCATAIT